MKRTNLFQLIVAMMFAFGTTAVIAQQKPIEVPTEPVAPITASSDRAVSIGEELTAIQKGEETQFDPGLGAGNGTHHRFPTGECTQFAADTYRSRTGKNITFGGNAKSWLVNARAAGYRTATSKSAIVPNAIIVMGAFPSSSYGHVMIVDQVRADTILISDSNWVARHRQSQRWIRKTDLDRYNFQGVILP